MVQFNDGPHEYGPSVTDLLSSNRCFQNPSSFGSAKAPTFDCASTKLDSEWVERNGMGRDGHPFQAN